MIRQELNPETCRLDTEEGSDACRCQIDSRLRQQCSKLKFQMDDVEVLGLSLCPFLKKIGRYVTVISRDITSIV